MPRKRIYATNADRQLAYNNRLRAAAEEAERERNRKFRAEIVNKAQIQFNAAIYLLSILDDQKGKVRDEVWQAAFNHCEQLESQARNILSRNS